MAVTEDDELGRLQRERSAAGRQAKWDKEVVEKIMESPNGRYWMERVLEFCRIYDMEHVTIDSTLITLGRKQVGAFLHDQLDQHAPDGYMRMLRERRVRMASEAEAKAKADKEKAIAERPVTAQDFTGEMDIERRMDEQAETLAAEEEVRRKPR